MHRSCLLEGFSVSVNKGRRLKLLHVELFPTSGGVASCRGSASARETKWRFSDAQLPAEEAFSFQGLSTAAYSGFPSVYIVIDLIYRRTCTRPCLVHRYFHGFEKSIRTNIVDNGDVLICKVEQPFKCWRRIVATVTGRGCKS